MAEKIPLKELAKMGVYNLKLEKDVTIETRVLGNIDLVDHFIPKWRPSLQSGQVIGVDAKYSTFNSFFGINRPCLLILSTQTHCFIIQLRGHKYLPSSVINLLEVKALCFVSMKSKLKYKARRSFFRRDVFCLVELAKVAARVLKNPGLMKCNDISKIAKEVGVPYKKVKMEGKWDAQVFSHEQVEAAVTDAYTCYASASKLFAIAIDRDIPRARIEMMPTNNLANIEVYNIKVGGDVTVKTRLLGINSMLDHFISEWKSSLPSGQVIGVDVKYSTSTSIFCINQKLHRSLLILSTQTQCLVIQLRGMGNCIPSSVHDFLNDNSFCFVGLQSKLLKVQFNVLQPGYRCQVVYPNCAVDVSDLGILAARVLKNPGVTNCCNMSQLAKEVGIPYEKVKKTGKWDAQVLSHEQVKAAMTDAYTCYASASKLFAML